MKLFYLLTIFFVAKNVLANNEECVFVNTLIGEGREPDEECCYTQGVTCDQLKHITEIDFSNRKFNKEIPQSFGTMDSLARLNLGGTGLTGNIPSDIGNLKKLQFLYLNNNKLEGEIPSSIGNLETLRELWLNANKLSGSIPPELASITTLMTLKLSYNNLSGVIPTAKFEALSYLNNLYLDNNSDLIGEIPNKSFSSCEFQNTSLCYSSSNEKSKCKYPEQHDCTACVENATAVDGICQCQGDFVGAGYINCYEKSTENECEFVNKLLGNEETYDCCSDTDVQCSFGHIIKIGFNNKYISAKLPESFGSMPFLKELLLNNNELTGSIPDVSGLKSLKNINLSTNKLSGLLPAASFETLTGLETISLHHNAELYGRVPNTSVYNNLNICSFGNTDLCYTKSDTDKQCDYPEEKSCTACVDNSTVVDNVCVCPTGYSGGGYMKCYNEETTSADECKFVNSLLSKSETNDCCAESGVECSYGHIININFENKNYMGNMPESFGKIPYLESLNLDNNQFSGSIPKDINGLTSLKVLKINDNNNLEGEIPSTITSLTNLEKLELSGNKIKGNVPTDLKKLTNLSVLLLQKNSLTGSISFIDGLVNLEELYLGGNEFEGSIPTSIGSLTKLKELNLSGNKLSGEIPTNEIAKLTKLTNIIIDGNQELYGKIPDTNKLELKACSFANTNLCNIQATSNGICIYPSNQQCDICKENASVVDGICKCNDNYEGLGYISCTQTISDNDLNSDSGSLPTMNAKSLFRLTYLAIIVVIIGML